MNELEKRAVHHRNRGKGLSPFCSLGESDKLESMATKTTYRAEYYEPRLAKWVSFYENSDLDKVKSNIDNPMIGNPKRRISEYSITGVRKPLYKFVKEISLTEERRKKQPYDSINRDAGNVEHNIAMFNKMSSSSEAPCANPVSGPFGGAAMAESLNMPKYTVDAFNWAHEKVTLTCYNSETDETFEKFISAGVHDEDRGRSNALAILKDPEYTIPTDIRNELISTYGLDDYGYQLEECTKKRELDDDFDMSMRTLL